MPILQPGECFQATVQGGGDPAETFSFFVLKRKNREFWDDQLLEFLGQIQKRRELTKEFQGFAECPALVLPQLGTDNLMCRRNLLEAGGRIPYQRGRRACCSQRARKISFSLQQD